MPVVFSTGSLHPFGLDRVYGWAAEAGFDGVEVMMDERWDTHQHAYINELSERHGIPVVALHPPIYRSAWRLGTEETLIRSARLAGKIGGPVVVAHPPPPGRPLARWSAGALAEARGFGVPVAVENMPKPDRGFTVRRKSCHRPEHLLGLGDVTIDTSHVGASGVELMEFWEGLKDQLRHVHLSDSDLSGGDQHRLPGKGKLPLREFLAGIGGSAYPGAISLELKPWPLGTPHPEVIMERMKTALEFTREGLDG
ncbi:sugar phosphate isomerase/epimerase family protein [Rubrobacter marinus]|uniref:sugar phosphate isomerase/epimerase family protein n=1 Tax=Rubrobacter marinus TaxID=2653852 RepID=UPI001D190746|nr:sugar phosphate isomerase/epimerase [Rubrobacter marinus]